MLVNGGPNIGAASEVDEGGSSELSKNPSPRGYHL